MRTVTPEFDDLVAKIAETPGSLNLLSKVQRESARQSLKRFDRELYQQRLKLGDFVPTEEWFEKLDTNQRQQVIDYFRSTHIGNDSTDVLSWYDTRQKFRVERNQSPVASR